MAKELLKLKRALRETTPMIPIRPLCQTILSASVLLLCSCSRCVVDQADINRDAASRCVQNIDAWKKDLAKLDRLEGKFDLVSDRIRRDYPKATPEEKAKLRAHSLTLSSRPIKPLPKLMRSTVKLSATWNTSPATNERAPGS